MLLFLHFFLHLYKEAITSSDGGGSATAAAPDIPELVVVLLNVRACLQILNVYLLSIFDGKKIKRRKLQDNNLCALFFSQYNIFFFYITKHTLNRMFSRAYRYKIKKIIYEFDHKTNITNEEKKNDL